MAKVFVAMGGLWTCGTCRELGLTLSGLPFAPPNVWATTVTTINAINVGMDSERQPDQEPFALVVPALEPNLKGFAKDAQRIVTGVQTVVTTASKSGSDR